MKDCVSCVHEYLSPMSDTCRECGIAMLNYEEAKPKRITNADRIRAMTDEELADWFIKIQNDVADYYDGGHAVAPELPTMENSWLDWLKQEANDD